ncbi:MAG: DUF1302 domain-containing protein [Deltaproteobacteria bacterium]|jgi:hypothetical protein|nr:DUF1302 domain-containing protein [Deltaproteobacteria bacterium]
MVLDGIKRCGLRQTILSVLLILLCSAPAVAFQFSLAEIEGNLDTTISYGMSWRMSERDKDIIGTANGGRAYSVNGDDGNLNYADDELVSQVAKITSDLELRWQNFGLFVRGSAFRDFENYRRSRERTELSDDAIDLVGRDAYFLDNYIWWDFDIGTALGQVRLGDQVLSWGESTFIQNSINTINPIDVSKFRLPGSELKEALVPVGMVSGSLSLNEYVTFEGFYQYNWEPTEVDPPGTYWSTNDFVGDGGYKVMFGWGDIPDTIEPGAGIGGPPSIGPAVPRGTTDHASDDGQFGLAVRLFVPPLNETEFGFYFINYHSRLPIISARTGTAQGFLSGDYASTARYFIEYPEDIKLYGVSFNTQLSGTGIALQGEYSYRQDAPIQVDDIELLLAAISPLDPFLAAATPPLGPEIFAKSQLGGQEFNSTIQGYKELDISQAQMTATKTFGPMFGADQFIMLGEVGVTYVHNMPSKSKLRFESPATYVSGNTTPVDVTVDPPGIVVPEGGPPLGPGVAHPGKPAESSDAFADDTSWGYRIVAKLDYNNAVGPITLSPRVAWAHDVEGNSPGPGGSFLEDRRAVTFGLNMDYLKTWSADISYTDFFGAGRYNLVNDRDILSFNIKYSF